MPSRIQNQLAVLRKGRGIGAADLARRVGVSRQTIYAIETGVYVPNTEVTLKLARELEVSVEEIFALAAESPSAPEAIRTEVLSQTAPVQGQPARVCQVGRRWVSVPVSVSPYFLPEAEGVISRVRGTQGKADLAVFSSDEASRKRLVLAGCDPASGVLSRMVEKISGVEIVPAAASSKLALSWLQAGKVHIAGSHLEDPESGEFNLPYLRREFPGEDFAVVTFVRWEEGLLAASGNPKRIRKIEDLARKGVRVVNRESGSGSRALLDRLLEKAGLPPGRVDGYRSEVHGHLAAAYSVLSGNADCCIATRSAARTFGLDFLPLKSERYDLIMRRQTLDLPSVQAFLDVLQRASLRRKLEVLAGYDTTQTGTVLA